MARLHLPQHPDRVFKDDEWGEYPSASGYRSLGSLNEPVTSRYGQYEAFAVVWDIDSDSDETNLFREITQLHPPFIAAEICKLPDGTPCAIGFYETKGV